MSHIFALSGSHGVGKSTLIKKLFDLYKDNNNIKLFQEFNIGLFRMGFALNGKGKSFNEILFSQNIAFKLYLDTIKYYLDNNDYNFIIMDRSCVDTYIYTNYFAKNINITSTQKEIINSMLEESNKILSKITTILVPPFVDSFDNDKDRMSEESRDNIWKDMLDFFANKPNHHFTFETNNSDDRINEFLSIIDKLNYLSIGDTNIFI